MGIQLRLLCKRMDERLEWLGRSPEKRLIGEVIPSFHRRARGDTPVEDTS